MSGKRPSYYHLKRRERYQWITQTIKGPRRVWRMDKWKNVSFHLSRPEADLAFDMRKGVGLEEFSIFYRGKRVR